METKEISSRLVNDLYRARLMGESEIDCANKYIHSIIDKKDTIIAYIMEFISEKDMREVTNGINELETQL